MLKDLFSNRLLIGAFALFIFCVGGSLLYQQHVEKQSSRELAETQERIKAITETPSLTAEAPVGDTSQGGDVLVDGDSRQSAGNPTESATTSGRDAAAPQLSEAEVERILAENRAQQAQRRADYIAEWGEPPPPDDSWQHYRDNHGDVHRHYRGTVAINDYDYITRFAPTPAELERYMQLRADLRAAQLEDERNGGSAATPSVEVQRLNNEVKSLFETAQREVPFPSGFGYYGESNSGYPSPAENERLRSIAIREFYQRFDMEHLYELHEESTRFYEKY
jgi:hypothetical protein